MRNTDESAGISSLTQWRPQSRTRSDIMTSTVCQTISLSVSRKMALLGRDSRHSWRWWWKNELQVRPIVVFQIFLSTRLTIRSDPPVISQIILGRSLVAFRSTPFDPYTGLPACLVWNVHPRRRKRIMIWRYICRAGPSFHELTPASNAITEH